MLDATFGWATLVSVIVIFLTLGLFWIMWLRSGYYEMPSSVMRPRSKTNKPPLFQTTEGTKSGADSKEKSAPVSVEPSQPFANVETNLFKFIAKMVRYLFFTDKEVILKDLGFEQMLFVHFMRTWIGFFFFVGVAVMVCVLVWARLATSNLTLVGHRLLGSKETTITSLDFDTFVSCLINVALTLQVLSLRRFLGTRLCHLIKSGEVKTHFHSDIWFQTRTLKFKGISKQDKVGEGFRVILRCYMKLAKIGGTVEKLIILPHMNKKIKLEIEKEVLVSAYRSITLGSQKAYTKNIWP